MIKLQAWKINKNNNIVTAYLSLISYCQFQQKVTELKEQSARRQEDLESLRKQVEAQARDQASNQVSDSAGSQQRDSRRLYFKLILLLLQ